MDSSIRCLVEDFKLLFDSSIGFINQRNFLLKGSQNEIKHDLYVITTYHKFRLQT